MNDSLTLSLEPIEGEIAVEQVDRTSTTSDMDVASTLQEALPGEDVPVQATWKRELRQRNILFVDDDQRFLDLCSRRFEASDYTIFAANGAQAALALMKENKIDVVISDMRMPEVSGAELMHEVERKYPDTIRIIISGKFDQADTIEAINKGHIYKYLTKPFNDRDLKLTIYQALLEKERREAEAQRIKDRQENAKRRAKQLGEVAAQCRSKMDAAYDECLWMMAKLIATHDDTPVKAASVAERLAANVGLDEAECRQIRAAALLQDISTIGKPAMPTSKMTSAEQKAWFRHPLMSAKLLSELGPFKQAAFIVKSHHERFDGKGFPCGLKGEEIPIGARIVALSTSYIRARRGCSLSHESAMKTLMATPSRFDPNLFEVLAGLELEQLLLR